MDLRELEQRAEAALDAGVFGNAAGGAFDELTLRANEADWRRIRLLPRVLRDVAEVSTATTVLGAPLPHPVAVAPTAFHRLFHRDGEEATAAGTAAAGALYVLPTRSTTPVEQVVTHLGGAPFWYQVYVLKDRGLTEELVGRAVEAGARALVLTGDTPVIGRRLRDRANRFVLPTNLGTIESLARPGNLGDQAADVTFDDVDRLGERFGLPVVVKGVLRADDARASVAAGAAAVWVSNHGGRQLDGAVSSAEALAEVCDAVAGQAEVYVDGGVRRGTDVLKALALGARAVFVGRPVIWGLVDGGAAGVQAVLDALVDELRLAMRLAGAATLDEVTPDLVKVGGPWGAGGAGADDG